MDTMAVENPQRQLKQQGSLRDLNGDSMGRTPVCISALVGPQRCFSVPVPVTGRKFGWTVSNMSYFWLLSSQKN